ncbi:hypothetical protein A2T98_04860 [Nodularia spumigena CENA596]|uniref:GmrSD restriction endonucleases N-terminal domain-containing protein n=1 Tax=Nodularia spumigena CENA596 TaxID=1819295 RepID=A0A161VUB1_NODSP|nr:DUF262 domain-containing protein [Nodularia spumigena]KZL50925.1 hypothetical protein A2T98_04860 [Nodularia spumigena CENA596]
MNNYELEFSQEENLNEEDNDEEEEKVTFQYDPEKINIVTREPTIEQLLRRIDEEALDLAPDFQRQANIWTPEAKSKLIESILIRIPLPAFYIDATNEDEWVVVDGLQRLSALKQFMIDKSEKRLKLVGLEYLKELSNKTYDELERRYQRRILETQVTVYLIEKGTPLEVKYNIFKRINTGGVPLSNQELRHALNPGQATKILANLASYPEFKKIVTLSEPKIKRMDDREFVVGFLAFYLISYQEYQYETRESFLSKALSKINSLSQEEIKKIEADFKKAMIAAFDIFNENAFRKLSNKSKRKFPLNKSLFEVWSVNLSRLSIEDIQTLKTRKQKLIDTFINYVDNDPDFLSSISQVKNKIEHRFKTVEQIIKEVLS